MEDPYSDDATRQEEIVIRKDKNGLRKIAHGFPFYTMRPLWCIKKVLVVLSH